jgi:hypothetical protein
MQGIRYLGLKKLHSGPDRRSFTQARSKFLHFVSFPRILEWGQERGQRGALVSRHPLHPSRNVTKSSSYNFVIQRLQGKYFSDFNIRSQHYK